MKNDFKNFPLRTKAPEKKLLLFLHGAKNGGKAKLFCWLALKLEGRLNWNNYGMSIRELYLKVRIFNTVKEFEDC